MSFELISKSSGQKLHNHPPSYGGEEVDQVFSIEAKAKHHAYQIHSLNQCADEPIAFCGAVQSFGYLLIVDRKADSIVAASANWAKLLGLGSIDELLGTSAETLFTDPKMGLDIDIGKLGGLLSLSDTIVKVRGRHSETLLFGCCYSQDADVIFEFEAYHFEPVENQAALTKSLFPDMKDIETEQAAFDLTVQRIREDSKYDRVMIYRFDQKWNGEVVAEAKAEKLAPFLHLKYPASDIPPQARELFLKNHPRIIPNAAAEAVPVVSHQRSVKNLNLSRAATRAVSAFHLQYLENMGVTATLSIPIRRAKSLWGLIACHHYSGGHYISPQVREDYELAAMILCGKLNELSERRRLQMKNETFQFSQKILKGAVVGRSLLSNCQADLQQLLLITGSTSAQLKIGDEEVLMGLPVSAETLQAVEKWITEKDPHMVWSATCLSKELHLSKPDPNAAGALAVALSFNFQDRLVWFRKEEIQETLWAGKPTINESSFGFEALTPRASFAAWAEISNNCSRPWQERDFECAENFLLGFVQEIFVSARSLVHTMKELKRLDGLKDQFIGNLSHELRTPIGIILGWVEILRNLEHHDPMAKRAIEIIERNAKIQAHMINDLLDVSRIVSGKMHLEIKKDVEVNQILSSLIESLLPSISAKRIQIKWHADPEVRLNVDSDRFRQIFWNLLNNAIKFTNDNGEIEVTMRKSPTEVQIQVADNGIGIPPERIDANFERFHKPTTAELKVGGLGIGLSIVKTLVEMHGGRISVQSRGQGQGTTVTVTFPRQVRALEATNESAKLRNKNRSKILSGLRVLLVEDNEDSRVATQLIIESEGAKVATAESGKEALSILSKESFDLIISDINMPKGDGHSLLKAWRKEEQTRGLSSTPAIALTAYATKADRMKAIGSGFTSHLAKPFNKGELVSVINSFGITRH